MKRIRFALIGLLAVAAGASRSEAQMPKTGAGSSWVLAPSFFPPGALITLVSGNPNEAAPFEVKLAFPKGYRILPHSHSTTIHVEVLKGSLRVGLGDRMNLKQTQVLAVGDTATVPANTHYYYAVPSVTILAIRTTGPFTLTYVDPSSDPSRSTGFPR